MVVHLLAVLVTLGLLAGPPPGPRDAVMPQAAAALVDDAGTSGDQADVTVVASGPLLVAEPANLELPLASPLPVLYHHPLFVFRPPRTAAFN